MIILFKSDVLIYILFINSTLYYIDNFVEISNKK
jgi:hypothetical protein